APGTELATVNEKIANNKKALYEFFRIARPQGDPAAKQVSNRSLLDFRLNSNLEIREMYGRKNAVRGTKRLGEPPSTQVRPGGVADLGAEILSNRNPKTVNLGIMVAGNSGLPGGDLANRDGPITAADKNHKGQEESIVANAILTKYGDDEKEQSEFWKATIGGAWGLSGQPNKTSRATLQRVDFVKSEDVNDYNGCNIVPDCQLEGKAHAGHRGARYNAHLFFANSVNASKGRNAQSTLTRTCNEKAVNDYDFFKECIKVKLRSSLDAMALGGVTHALVAKLSCGINAGPHKAQINKDFAGILQEVLNEPVGPNRELRGQYFEEVIIADRG
ncbi:hypothetical protein SCG7109_CC_00020, partial [Chlamydiales bacterium SCGC AG-110-M15]